MVNDLLIRKGSFAVLCAALLGISVAACGGSRAPAIVARPQMPYIIGADDILTVTFWQDRMPQDVVVRPDGKISMPLLNDLPAAGYTPQQLAVALEEMAAKYITEPQATVTVKESRSRKVFVLGEVATPGMVQLNADMNVLQLIAVGGGLLEYADRGNIVIIRTEHGQETRFKFNYNDVLDGKRVEQNILLRPGDTVVVR